MVPKHLDEKVVAFHLPMLGAKLMKLSPKHAEYINVHVEGPCKFLDTSLNVVGNLNSQSNISNLLGCAITIHVNNISER